MATAPEEPRPAPPPPTTLEMPAPTAWPLVLSVGVAVLALGLATNYTIAFVGFVVFVISLVGWVAYMLPGRGHIEEPFAAVRARPPASGYTVVEHLEQGRPGYRFRVPEKVHPISSGVRGGIVGGIVMPIPTLIYGVVSGHGIWFPVNLLAAMVIPQIQTMSVEQLNAFHLLPFLVGVVIHIVLSIGFGLMYGVVLPMLPTIRGGPIIWGGVLMPLFWTAMCYGMMGVTNPLLEQYVDWGWFLLSQFVYGVAMSAIVFRSEKVYAEPVRGYSAGDALDRLTGEEGNKP